ncbi:aspartate/glutamate racemase family protein [Vreelandella nigrificans]|uniref:Hydrogenase expression protein HupH n=1 Tax=Vreelandella nigrificans TaxID=2042704 RepID=A0A2A4HII8_9GAMM|nr:aspartate/glutamate racemase family protein [Halomonas nigrificans]PCF94722.1 hydrogenase expression protein HupH [Halomonas nigrificans]
MKHLLLLNGNTNLAMTEAMASRAQQLLGDAVKISTMTANESVAYIGSQRDCVAAAAAVVNMAEHCFSPTSTPPDALLLACFGEPGMAAVREFSPVPVVGMLEASVLTAMQLGARFSIITPGRRWPRMIEDTLNGLGVSRHCLGIDAVVIDDLALPEQREQAKIRLQKVIDEQCSRLAPDVIIIGGAALAGLRDEVAHPPSIKLLDSLDAALAQTNALMTLPKVNEPFG